MKLFYICFLGILSLSLSALAETADPQPELPKKNSVRLTENTKNTSTALLEKAAETLPASERDPFASSFEKKIAVEAEPVVNGAGVLSEVLVLQGVAIGENKATAVINGKTYVKGKTRDNIELIEVRKREADIKVNGASQTISFQSKMEKDKKKVVDLEDHENNQLRSDVLQEGHII